MTGAMRTMRLRRYPAQAFDRPWTPEQLAAGEHRDPDLGAGLTIGTEVTVSLGGNQLGRGVVTELDDTWVVVTMTP